MTIKIRNSEFSPSCININPTQLYSWPLQNKNLKKKKNGKTLSHICVVILWFYSPILQIISFYLPTLPQSDFLKDIRNNFTSCNIIIQKKGCKLTKNEPYKKKIKRNKSNVYLWILRRVWKKKNQIENKTHLAWKFNIFIHETQIHNFCFGFFSSFFYYLFSIFFPSFHLGVSLYKCLPGI